jgi:hypothetical protein
MYWGMMVQHPPAAVSLTAQLSISHKTCLAGGIVARSYTNNENGKMHHYNINVHIISLLSQSS